MGQIPREGLYRFGPNHIKLEDLVLLELRPVSPASFQPVLCIRSQNND